MGKMWHVIYGILFSKKREKLLVESQKHYAERQNLVKKKKNNLYEALKKANYSNRKQVSICVEPGSGQCQGAQRNFSEQWMHPKT